MSGQKMVVPGFGIGTFYGTPNTIALLGTSTLTLTGTVLLAGQYQVAGLVAGTSLIAYSTSNGVTGTYTLLSGAPGDFQHDGASCALVSATSSVSIVFITI